MYNDHSTAALIAGMLGGLLPALGFLVIVVVVLLLYRQRHRREKNEWEIDMGELEMEQVLGAGGYGEVYKARWRGTEVAVKRMISKNVTKDMQRNFIEEVRTAYWL